MTKPYDIPKMLVWQAFQHVKANGGAAGIDRQSIEEFERNRSDNLYRIWNRMSSGSYFPPAVKCVPIPKKTGGTRKLGIPTVADRIAQTVVKMVLEPVLEPMFDDNSFGYRPGRSALDAITLVRSRNWKYDWVVEFDIKSLFDEIDHELLLKAVRKHCSTAWVLLYIERWLGAPMMLEDGTLVTRTRGTPQGGVVSPLLANLFLHYVLDAWVRREMPSVRLCRYADDGVVHCSSHEQAVTVLQRIGERLRECGLALHPAKTRIAYCQDVNRRQRFAVNQFTFLGYTFRPRKAADKYGRHYVSFLPAVSSEALCAMRQRLRRWHLQLKVDKSIGDLSKKFNPILRGWANYYGRFYASALEPLWRSVNDYLARWLRRKYKHLARHAIKSYQVLGKLAAANRRAFWHWERGMYPGGSIMGAG